MKTKGLFCKTVSVFLCLCMVFSFFTEVSAEAHEAVTYYLQDIKIIYADSAAEAKSKVPKGYLFYEQNINDGTNELGVYLCYRVTSDASEAITDVRVMNENSGFNRGDFNEKMDSALDKLGEQAKAIHSAIINEFVPNLNNGLPGAQYAFDQLNIFMFDDNTRLGDYIKSGKITAADVSKMLLVCHNVVISAVLSLIAQGLQRPEGEDWLDKLEKKNPADYEFNAELQKKYADLILRFQEPMSNFSDMYNIMVYTDEVRDSMTVDQVSLYSEDLANEETVKWWYSLWEILDSHELAGGSGLTAEHIFVEAQLGEGVANHKICMLIESLTEGQRALMQLVGPINFILSDVFTEDTRIKAESGLTELKNENGTVSLWGGVNMDIFDSEVGITGAAYDEMVTAANYDIFTQENDVLEKSVEDYISLVSNYAGIVSGGLSILSGILVFVKGYSGTIVAIRAIAHISAFLTSGLLGCIFTYGTIAITVVCILVSLIIWIVDEIKAGKPPAHDRTTIPKYMIDSVVDNAGAQLYETYTRVNNVQSDSELAADQKLELSEIKNMSGSDINANKGYNWAALYVSYSGSVGNPIEAEFAVAKGMDVAPDGFIALRHFNRKSEAVNLNGVDKYNATDPSLFLYYRGEKLSKEHKVYKYIRQIQAVEVSLRDPKNPKQYRFNTEEAMAVARKELEEASPEYYVIDHNFSNDPEVVVMIGWNGTNEASDAIKDIRLVHESTVGKSGAGLFGEITYANMGKINGYSLFVCRLANTEIPPVTRIKVVKKDEDPSKTKGISINVNEKEASLDSSGAENHGIGWEPVNEFTGGSAVPLGNVGAQLYFLPETTFTEGPDYLAGIELDAYITNLGFPETSAFVSLENCCHEDIWDNDYNKYREYKEKNFGEHFYDSSVLTVTSDETKDFGGFTHKVATNNPDCPYTSTLTALLLNPKTTSAVKYHLTKNPYRAIYGVSLRNGTADTLRNSFTNYDGFGYALCPIEATISACHIDLIGFDYYELVSSGKPFVNKTTILNDRPYRSEKIVVNKDITQIFWSDIWDNLKRPLSNMYVMGYTQSREPLVPEDLIFSEKMLVKTEYPDNFTPIPHMGGDGTAVEVVSPFTDAVPVKLWHSADYGTTTKRAFFKNLYGYVRSEIGKGDDKRVYYPGEGKYISNIYLASKENIRTSGMLSANAKAKCSDVSYAHLEDQLVNKGATNIFTTNIGTDYYSGGKDNANTVYFGVSRTNDESKAIRDIRFYICEPGETPKRVIKTDAVIPGQVLEYELVDGISLTSKANLPCEKEKNNKGMEVWTEKGLLEERQAYLYVCRNKIAFPNAITEIQISDWCSFGAYTPVLTIRGETLYTVKTQKNTELYMNKAWLNEGKMISFRREGDNSRYVSKMTIEYGSDKNQVKAKLIEAGYSVVNKDMNQSAAGPHIYIGCKYSENANEAITNLLTLHNKNHYAAYSVTDEAHIYYIVSEVDLNKGAGGDYIYLYYTRDPRAGKPLLDVYGNSGITEYSDSGYNYKTVRRLWDYDYSNLNAGTTVFTANIYLSMKREGNSGRYISDIMVAYGWSKNGAIEKLREAGYDEFIDKDMNAGTGSTQYVYIGFKRTDDPNKAIRDLQILTKAKDEVVYINGIDYRLTSDVNLNRHCVAWSPDLYLYYTKNSNAGDPITELYCAEKPVFDKKDLRGLHKTVKEGNEYIDLNRLAGGEYIYLVMISPSDKETNQGDNKDLSTSTIVGNGSWISVSLIVVGIGTCGAILLARKKRRAQK